MAETGNIREIIRLIVLEASEREGQSLARRIYTIKMEIMMEMVDVLMTLKESERDEHK